jgi:nucleoside recognition membrane protein YjiH
MSRRRLNKNKLQFLLPSLLGVLIFLTPIRWDGNLTIGIGIVTGWIEGLMGAYGLHFVIGLLVATSVLTVLGTMFSTGWIHRHPMLKNLFDVPRSWLALRLVGIIFGLIYLLQIGPELLTSEEIGGAVFSCSEPRLFCPYYFSAHISSSAESSSSLLSITVKHWPDWR